MSITLLSIQAIYSHKLYSISLSDEAISQASLLNDQLPLTQLHNPARKSSKKCSLIRKLTLMPAFLNWALPTLSANYACLCVYHDAPVELHTLESASSFPFSRDEPKRLAQSIVPFQCSSSLQSTFIFQRIGRSSVVRDTCICCVTIVSV